MEPPSGMSPADIAAYIGAAAWLPQIGTWVYRLAFAPVVSIIPERRVEIGFTGFGPIFNLRLGMTVNRHDIVITGLEATLIHEDGDKHPLVWVGMRENLGEISDPAGNRGAMEKEHPAIAVKLSTTSLVERFVRFQEPKFHAVLYTRMADAGTHMDFLRKSSKTFRQDFLASRQLHDLIQHYRDSFWWKAGRYFLDFDIVSAERGRLETDRLWFRLTPLDVDGLKANLEQVPAEIENLVNADNPDYQKKPIDWQWRSLALTHA